MTYISEPVFRKPLKSGIRLGLFLIVFTFFSVLISVLWQVSGAPAQSRNGQLQTLPFMFSGIVFFCIILFSVYIVLRGTRTGNLCDLIFTARSGKYILPGFVFGLLTPLSVCLFFYLSGGISIDLNNFSYELVINEILPFVIFFIFQAGFEEILFRGYVLHLLIEGTGKYWAVAITSLLFAAFHAGNPGADVTGLINTAVNGALLAAVVIRSGSVVFAWAYHASWNIFSSIILGWNVSGIKLKASFLRTGGSKAADLNYNFGFESLFVTGLTETIILVIVYAVINKYFPDDSEMNVFNRKNLRRVAVPSSEGSTVKSPHIG